MDIITTHEAIVLQHPSGQYIACNDNWYLTSNIEEAYRCHTNDKRWVSIAKAKYKKFTGDFAQLKEIPIYYTIASTASNCKIITKEEYDSIGGRLMVEVPLNNNYQYA